MRAILTYHSIDPSGSVISIDEEAFRGHVKFLAGGAVKVVPLNELLTLPKSVDAVSLTFDDGFESIAKIAAPLLADAGLPATVFVVSDLVGRTNNWDASARTDIPTLSLLDWDQVGLLHDSGFTVGAHSRSHRDLTRLAPDELASEVSEPVSRITEALGSAPSIFCYPYGRVNIAVREAVAEHFSIACGTDFRAMRNGSDPLDLPRLDTYYLRSSKALERWGTPAFARYLDVRAKGRVLRALASRLLAKGRS